MAFALPSIGTPTPGSTPDTEKVKLAMGVLVEAVMIRYILGTLLFYLIIGLLYAYKGPSWVAYTLLSLSTVFYLYVLWVVYAFSMGKPPIKAVLFIVVIVVLNIALMRAFAVRGSVRNASKRK